MILKRLSLSNRFPIISYSISLGIILIYLENYVQQVGEMVNVCTLWTTYIYSLQLTQWTNSNILRLSIDVFIPDIPKAPPAKGIDIPQREYRFVL